LIITERISTVNGILDGWTIHPSSTEEEMQNPHQKLQQDAEHQVVALRLPTSRPIITYVLLAIIVIVFVAQMVTDQLNFPDQPLLRFGAVNYRRILAFGEYYRLFTAMFLHVNQVHIFFNGIALWQFGQSVERFFGHTRFALIYFLGGLCGSIASFIFTRGLSVGASAAIFAIFGAEMVFLYRNRRLLGPAAQRELRSLIILLVINLGLGFYTQFGPSEVIIDNWAHIGGFFAGVVLAWFIAPQYHLQTDLTAPTGYHVEDSNPMARSWLAPTIFGFALLVVLIYAAGNLKPFR
jgi:rhomboid protease GluP